MRSVMIDCPAMRILRPARLGFRRRSGATATSTAMGLIAIEQARILFRGNARRRKLLLRADSSVASVVESFFGCHHAVPLPLPANWQGEYQDARAGPRPEGTGRPCCEGRLSWAGRKGLNVS